MPSQRFFIGNLSINTTENDVSKAFKDFGDVTAIDLKEKENLVDPGNVKKLAFVTLNLYDADVDFCLRKINSKPINGEYVRVSVAKESFLERLKREREESEGASSKKKDEHVFKPPEKDFTTANNSKKTFDIEEDANGIESANIFDDDDILITKKKASNSMRNGKIVIEGTNNAPLHVIGKQKEVKRLSEKSFDSEKKRKESVKKKKNQYQQQKSLIQKSLSSVDVSTKKITFDDDGEVDDDIKPSKATPLFHDSDEENDGYAKDFALKSEYEGSQGAELMKLQSKMSLDPRFKIDHKFVEGIKEKKPVNNGSSERDWQYGILEQVTKVSQPKGQERSQMKMIRYDPSKANQDEFLRKRPKIEDQEEEDAAPAEAEKNKVSQEVFYVVSDNLTNSLKTRGEGFSLLSMFGKSTDGDEKNEELQKEKILISKNDKNSALNPFTYDSSESENEQEDYSQKTKDNVKTNGVEIKASSKAETKLFVESFFIPRNDARLKEGKLFFRSIAQSENQQDYDSIKDKLKTIINTKINKTKRQSKGTFKKKSNRVR